MATGRTQSGGLPPPAAPPAASAPTPAVGHQRMVGYNLIRSVLCHDMLN